MEMKIGRGLVEARRLAVEHWRVLLVYVGLGVVFPFLFLSSDPIFSLRNIMAIVSDPWTNRVGGSITGPLYLLGIVAVITAGAMLAAWSAIQAEIREGYVGELMYGMVAGFAYLIANIVLVILAGLIATIPLFILGPEVLLGGNKAMLIGIEIYRFLTSLVGGWVGARLCLAGAIMGGRGKLEPVSAFIESWRRTRSAQWRLYGFYLLYGVAFAIPFAGLAMLHGAIIMTNEPGSLLETLMSFGWVLLLALYFLGQILIPAGLYRASESTVQAREVFA